MINVYRKEELSMRLLYVQPWNFSDLSQRKRFQKGYLSSLFMPRAMFEALYRIGPDIKVDILDLNIELLENSEIDIKGALTGKLSVGYDAAFISFPAVALGNGIGEIIRSIKEYQPSCLIVVGGGATTLIREDILKFWPADFCYLGDGVEIPQIIEQLKTPKTFHNIFGLYRRIGEKIFFPQQDGPNQLLDDYLPEDFFSINKRLDFAQYLKRYERLGIKPCGLLEMTRGCSYSCNFCVINKSGSVRFRKPSTVISEAEFLLKNGVNEFYLIDPTLGLNLPLTERLLDLLGNLKVKFPEMKLLGITRCDLITNEFARKLQKAGFNTITLGVETMDRNQLRRINKKTIVTQNEEAIKVLCKNGIRPRLALMHFPDVLSFETVKFLVALSQQKIDFLVQSSFYRPLYQKGSYEEAPDFRRWDQRVDCRSIGLDSNASVLEWLFCNLAFPSTDINRQEGDSELRAALARFNLADIRIDRDIDLSIIINDKYFLYQPTQPFQIIKSGLWVGDDLSYLDQAPNVLRIDLRGGDKDGKTKDRNQAQAISSAS